MPGLKLVFVHRVDIVGWMDGASEYGPRALGHRSLLAAPHALAMRDRLNRDIKHRSHDPERRQAWLRDQYQHPEEHRHTIAEVQRWFAEHGVEYLRTYPSTVFDDTPDDLFAGAADNCGLESWLTQIAWMRTLGREGGLFFTIGRKERSQSASRSPAAIHDSASKDTEPAWAVQDVVSTGSASPRESRCECGRARPACRW